MRLIPLLEKYRNNKGVVIAIPRGGVSVAYYIAKKLQLQLELMLTKKIGHPFNPELAIGAVSLESRVIDPRMEIDQHYIEAETARIRKGLEARYHKFMGNRKSVDLKGKIVIVVDDGVATGSTMLAAIEMIRHKEPEKVVVAVPVASVQAAEKLKAAADEFICVATPRDFSAVGQFYKDFSQVSDEEVISLLNDIRNYPREA